MIIEWLDEIKELLQNAIALCDNLNAEAKCDEDWKEYIDEKYGKQDWHDWISLKDKKPDKDDYYWIWNGVFEELIWFAGLPMKFNEEVITHWRPYVPAKPPKEYDNG